MGANREIKAAIKEIKVHKLELVMDHVKVIKQLL